MPNKEKLFDTLCLPGGLLALFLLASHAKLPWPALLSTWKFQGMTLRKDAVRLLSFLSLPQPVRRGVEWSSGGRVVECGRGCLCLCCLLRDPGQSMDLTPRTDRPPSPTFDFAGTAVYFETGDHGCRRPETREAHPVSCLSGWTSPSD